MSRYIVGKDLKNKPSEFDIFDRNVKCFGFILTLIFCALLVYVGMYL